MIRMKIDQMLLNVNSDNPGEVNNYKYLTIGAFLIKTSKSMHFTGKTTHFVHNLIFLEALMV